MPNAFQFDTYDPTRNVGTIGSLMMAPAQARARALREGGQVQAQAAQASGQNTAQLVGSLGELANQGVQAWQQNKAAAVEAKRESALRELLTQPDAKPEQIYQLVGPERGLKIVTGLSALHEAQTTAQGKKIENATKGKTLTRDILAGMDALPETLRAEVYPGVRSSLLQAGAITEQDSPEAYSPEWWTQARNFGQAAPTKKEPGTRQVEVTNPDGSKTVKIVTDTAGQEFTSAPVKKEVTYSAPTAGMVNGKRAFFRAGSDGKVYDMNGLPVENVTPINESGGSEPLIAILKDGKPTLVRRSLAEGMTPASGREQGRPVVSGDANKLSDFDTSLDDADVLSAVIKEPGTLAKIQSWAPSWVTEITGGWGADAKSQNAVISRVRQVIGKALEGGVLRKEDEVKYKDILPVIGDTKEVVDSKLAGLKSALAKRKARLLDSLEDAGYEVGKFRERQTKIDAERNAGSAGSAPDFVWDAKAGKLVPNPKKGGGE